MPNYGIFTNFCVLQLLIQKGEISSKKEEQNNILQYSMSRLKFVCHDKLPSNYQRNHVVTTFPVSQHHNLIVDN